jgi:PTH1 family peptidyl-tRNA hydrolase
MHLVIGLGNKGREYAMTRHNIGFEAVDRFAEGRGIRVFKPGHHSLFAKAGSLIVAKPQTYMNLSGQAARALMEYYKVPLENILVVHDDMDFAPGAIKLRKAGSGGAHNGVKDILSALGSQSLARIRIGIGRPEPGDMREYVLARFRAEEVPLMRQAVEDACGAIESFLSWGIDRAMNEFNRKGE